MSKLARLLRVAMRQKGISEREAGREAGVAHTTIARILSDKPVGINTIERVSKWLEIDPATVVSDGNDAVAMLSAMIEKSPKLKEALDLVAEKFERNEIDGETVQEICRYIIWRLKDD